MSNSGDQILRIGVVGAGISGLIAAAELHRAGHRVSVFEAGSYPGGHSNTVTVEGPECSWEVDTGFIVLNDRNYPNFERILAELEVPTQPAQMSFGVSDPAGDFEWSARPFGLFAQPGHAVDRRFLRMLVDLLRFNRDLAELVGLRGSGPSLQEFLAAGDYSDYFIERLIVPQVSAVWSADPAQIDSFPASFLAEFFHNHGTLEVIGKPKWRTIPGGSRRYVEALTRPFADRIHLSSPATRIERTAGGVRVDLPQGSEEFDQVVIATHSDQALRLLAMPTTAESEILGAMAYQPNQAVLHTDTAVMPTRRAAWASWNFHLSDEPRGAPTVTYDLSRLQSIRADRTFLVSLNHTEAIDPERIIRKIDYAHPVFTRESVAAQRRWLEVSGADRIHYCGAYWRWGFHEDGVWSGLRVSEALGGRGPGLGGAVAPALDVERDREPIGVME